MLRYGQDKFSIFAPPIGTRMEGGALNVRCGNGIEVSGAGLNFHLDPRSLSTKKVPAGDGLLHLARPFGTISPAPSSARDPTASSPRSSPGASSPRSREGRYRPEHCDRVQMHDAGHVTGSVMFEMDIDGQKVLYTGDFSPGTGSASRGPDRSRWTCSSPRPHSESRSTSSRPPTASSR